MDWMELMHSRHSVRQYLDRPLEPAAEAELRSEIERCNQVSGLHIQLITGEPEAFGGMMAHYGKFSGVTNYVALIGPKGPMLQEQLGYWGEHIVLMAQGMGLNTCWVALTFSKSKCRAEISPKEKLVCVLALGYGATQGIRHMSKPMETLCQVDGDMPEWFHRGMQAALLAPTAINQQKFLITLRDDGRVDAKSTGGFYSKVDLGIVKYHFEKGAGKDSFTWV